MESNSTGSFVTSVFHLAGFQGSFVFIYQRFIPFMAE